MLHLKEILARKVMPLAMASLFLGALLVGCSTQTNDEKPSDTVAEAETTEAKYLDGLPETMDLDMETIRFICETETVNKLTERSLISEEITGDIVDDAVYKRNSIIMDRFNVDFEIVKMGGTNEVPGLVRQSVLANSDDYDIVCGYEYYAIRLGSEGILLNLNNVPNLDFSQPYWSQRMIEGMSYGDAAYWCTGDLSLRYIGGMYVTFVNKAIWSDYFPDMDPYDVAMNGEWTLDLLYDMSTQVYDDLNADGKFDNKDLYGLYYNAQDDICEAIMMSANVMFGDRDDDGIPYIDYDLDRMVTVCEKMTDLAYNNEGVRHSGQGIDDVCKQFAEGTAMTTMTRLYYSEMHFREMEDDFAVIPMPKMDAEQEEYVTTLHDGTTIFGLPITNSKLEASTIVLEAMAAESYRTVSPVYYEMALKIKYVRDDMSAIMIDIIRDAVTADFCFYWHVGDNGTYSGYTHFFRALINGQTNFVSQITSMENAWYADMEELLEDLEKYAD